MPIKTPSPSWLRLSPAVLLLAAVLVVMRDTAASMVEIWSRSETFTHAFLVPPIVLWLVWRRRAVLAATPSRPVPWLLLPIAAVCLLWLMGELANVAAASQFALVTVIVLSVPALFGWAMARQLTFPLCFLYFAVPLGEFAVPQFMEWTADFTVLALQLTGIPVYREGLEFVIPSGNWSVVAACSGVRYLLASFMVGTLFAYLNYRSPARRATFMLVSILVPIVANWLRAYMIVMIGHLSGNSLAVGVDHLIYGWVFFGGVIFLMFFIGARWAEPDAPAHQPAHPVAALPARAAGWTVAAAILTLVVGAQAWAWRVTHPDGLVSAPLQLPAVGAGWTAGSEPPLPWTPGFRNPNAVSQRTFVAGDRPLWLWIGHYAGQDEEHKLVTSVNRLVPRDDKGWSVAASGSTAAAEGLPTFRSAELRSRGALGGDAAPRIRVWHVYWINGRWVAGDARAKVLQAADRLAGRGDDGAVVVLATPLQADTDAFLADFARAYLPALNAAMAAARDTR